MRGSRSSGSLPVLSLLALLLPGALSAQAPKLREPLPLDVALSLVSHNSRSPINFSPDGQWIAHTVQRDETIPRDTIGFIWSATGFSFAEGDSRMQATLTSTRTGRTITLGGTTGASWAATWSPDGERVAFYSDDGGEAGLWIWEKSSGRATRVPDLIVRPYFGFEVPAWSHDGTRILVKALPAGLTIAEGNARGATGVTAAPRFPPHAPDSPSVFIRRFDLDAQPLEAARSGGTGRNPPVGDMSGRRVDLAVIDVASRAVTRIVTDVAVDFHAFSPDSRSVAFTVIKGWEANSQQSNMDLAVRDLAGGPVRVLATNVRMGYGIEWAWSPDSRTIAYTESGQLGSGAIVLVPAGGGEPRVLQSSGVPSFNTGEGEYPPYWSADGKSLFAVGGGALWRVDAASGNGTPVASIPGWSVFAPVTPFGQPVLWTDGGRTAFVVARDSARIRTGIYAVDLAKRATRPVLVGERTISGIFNVGANTTTRALAFVSTDQQHLQDIWLLDAKTGAGRQASHLNERLEAYELGQARMVSWTTADGRSLRGALLLPPGHTPGRRLPLVVWVYGGDYGSRFINRFGLWGNIATFNMHVLATRGFAVLSPDAPLREGHTMDDVMATVMPGVDAVIEQGWADTDRLAVMGQSYGSFNTLSIITQTNRFKAAVISAAVLHPDLFTDYLRSIGYYEHGQGNMGGSIWEYHDRYASNSPLFLFDRIVTPLMIAQGEKDGDLVPSDAIFAALERLRKPVEYLLYEGEGHVITQKPNVLDFWNRRLAFLARHLKLSYDPKGAITFDGDHARE